jgi:hypothetical protein
MLPLPIQVCESTKHASEQAQLVPNLRGAEKCRLTPSTFIIVSPLGQFMRIDARFTFAISDNWCVAAAHAIVTSENRRSRKCPRLLASFLEQRKASKRGRLRLRNRRPRQKRPTNL